MLQISSVRLYVEGTTLKIDFKADWIEPYQEDEFFFVTFSGPGDPRKVEVPFHWHSGFYERPTSPSFVRDIADITELPEGKYVLLVYYWPGQLVPVGTWRLEHYLLEKWYLISDGSITEIQVPSEPPSTVEVKFDRGVVRDAVTREVVDKITSETIFDLDMDWIVTAPAGTTFNVVQFAKAGSKVYRADVGTFTLPVHYYGEPYSFGSIGWKGSALQAWLGITSSTTIELGQEVYYQGELIASGSVSVPLEVYPPIEPDIIIDEVLVMDNETLMPVSKIVSDRDYYFQVKFRARGSPGVEYHIQFYVPKPQGYFTLMDVTWTFRDYKKDYETYSIATPYAVSGKWIIDMVRMNIGDVSEIDVCCKFEWTWEGESKSRSGCNKYAIETEVPPAPPTPPPPAPSILPLVIVGGAAAAILATMAYAGRHK